MLGDRLGHVLGGDPHPGCGSLKLKAAETGTIIPWVINALRRFGGDVAHRDDLLVAGEYLEAWLLCTRVAGSVLNEVETRTLRDSAQKHLLACQTAGVHLVPKHHCFWHLSLSAERMGNPKLYSCFWMSL